MWLAHQLYQFIPIMLALGMMWAVSRSASASARNKRVVFALGSLMIVGSVVLLFQPEILLDWNRVATADKVASAEFPGAPHAEEIVVPLGPTSVRTERVAYKVPKRDMELALSHSPFLPDLEPMTHDQRVAAIGQSFAAQGFTLVQNEKQTTASPPLYRLTFHRDQEKVTMQSVLALVGNDGYWATATWSDSDEKRSVTDRFLGSLVITGSVTR